MTKAKVVSRGKRPGPLAREGSRVSFMMGFAAGILVSLLIVHLSLTYTQRQLAELQAEQEQAVPVAVDRGATQT